MGSLLEQRGIAVWNSVQMSDSFSMVIYIITS